jgi:hypothetical protein
MTNKTPDASDPLNPAMNRIRSEYREMPGLCLTFEQMQRLWMLDRTTCRTIITRLVDAQFLKATSDGHYVRCEFRSTTRRGLESSRVTLRSASAPQFPQE